MTDHGNVVFNGDGYSDDWQIEAASRGLKNLRTTVDALPELDSEEVRDLLGRYAVLNDRELASRYEVYLEQYHLTVSVEAKATLEIGQTMILPAAMRYQRELAEHAASLKAIDYAYDTTLLDTVSKSITELSSALAHLGSALAHDEATGTYEEAKYACDALVPAMAGVRIPSDHLEALIADDLWPLPTYQEMLHIL